MTSNATSAAQLHRDAIQALVTAGKIKHERPGIYMDETMTESEIARVPPYDIPQFQAAFPTIQLVEFEEIILNGKGVGFIATLFDGREEPRKVEMKELPSNTEALIKVVQEYFRKALDVDAMESGMDVFDI